MVLTNQKSGWYICLPWLQVTISESLKSGKNASRTGGLCARELQNKMFQDAEQLKMWLSTWIRQFLSPQKYPKFQDPAVLNTKLYLKETTGLISLQLCFILPTGQARFEDSHFRCDGDAHCGRAHSLTPSLVFVSCSQPTKHPAAVNRITPLPCSPRGVKGPSCTALCSLGTYTVVTLKYLPL